MASSVQEPQHVFGEQPRHPGSKEGADREDGHVRADDRLRQDGACALAQALPDGGADIARYDGLAGEEAAHGVGVFHHLLAPLRERDTWTGLGA